MASKKKPRRKNTGPHIFWRGGRAYGDFRAYAAEGGKKAPLAEKGSTWGTGDQAIAEALFAAELTRLQEKRRTGVGIQQQRNTTLDVLVRDHLIKKRTAKKKTSLSHLNDLDHRLRVAVEYFGAKRDPRSIEPDDVRRWSDDLSKSGKRKDGTVRHFLNALSGLYGRAQEGLYVDPGYNPVALWTEKPSGKWKAGEADFFDVAEAALLLEAARVVEAREKLGVGADGNRMKANAGLHAIVATMLLTGARFSEATGLDVSDISFDRGLVRFRPNAHRDLKTETSEGDVPLWPQLREVLQEWMYGGDQPRTEGLLFPSVTGGMIQDLRKSLDAMGELCGMEPGEVRTRAFRHTYCSARLQTVQRILKPGREPSDPEAWEYVEVSKFTVAKEMRHGGTQLVDRIYGHLPRTAHRSDVVEYRVEKHRETLGNRLTTVLAAAGRD